MKALGLLLLIGLGLMYVQLKRGEQSKIYEVAHKEMTSKKLHLSSLAECQSICFPDMRKTLFYVMEDGSYNTKLSKPKTEPCPTYVVEGKVGGKHYQFRLANCDDHAELVELLNLPDCDCQN
jgi:hypothetical protein